MVSRLIRRTHMYLALFLAPWLLMYAASTVAMNHRPFFEERYGAVRPPRYEAERTVRYENDFTDATPTEEMAARILRSLDLDGAHVANRRPDGTLVIVRNDLRTPRRITYSPDARELVIERQTSGPNALLERFHRRRGWGTGYKLDTAWAVTIDVVAAAMVFWALSGAWMWWELRGTRRFGAVAILVGAGLFVLSVVTI